MGRLGTSNLNLNLNLNLGAGAPALAGPPRGTRINTQEYRKLVDRAAFPFAPGSAAAVRTTIDRIAFREFWDGELQSYVYLNEFVTSYPKWLDRLKEELKEPLKQLRQTIDEELVAVVDAAPERESRFAEIVQQDSAEGALSYWFGMLSLDPANAPATCLLMRVARRVGELAAMCLKHEFRFPRPSQLCPAIVPMIDPPVTPSFPSGHALQSRLISRCLQEARGDLPQAEQLLADLAERVAENRVIAGLHYWKDNEAGVKAADACYAMLNGLPMFQAVVRRAKQELVGDSAEHGREG